MEVEELKQAIRELLSGNLTGPAKIAKARQVVEALTDNPMFPNPDPPLEQLTATIDAFERASREAEFAEYQAQVSEREYRDSESALLELLKAQPRN